MATTSTVWLPPALIHSRFDANYNSPLAVATRAKLRESGEIRFLEDVIVEMRCGPFGSTIVASEHSADGDVILIQPTDISGGGFTLTPGWKIKREQLNEKGLSLCPPNSLLFARKGIYAHCAVLPELAGEATLGSSMIGAVIDKSKADAYFLEAYFRSRTGNIILSSLQMITASPTIGTGELADAALPYPDPSLQKAIGHKVRASERLRASGEHRIQAAIRNLEGAIGWPIPLDSSQISLALSHELGHRIDPLPYLPRFVAVRNLLKEHGAKTLQQIGATAVNGCENRDFVPAGQRYLLVRDMETWHLKSPQNWACIAAYADVPDKARPDVGDLLCVRTGPVGYMVSWEPCYGKAVLSSHWIRIRGNEDQGFDAGYMAILSQLSAWQIMMQAIVYGAVQPQISQEEILDVPVPFIGTELAKRCSQSYRKSVADAFRAKELTQQAISEVENLIDGKLDEDRCLAEGLALAKEFGLEVR